jgi:gliding motility-associated-like protein
MNVVIKALIILFAVVSLRGYSQVPPVINGLTLHLDANTGLVGGNPAVWIDQSGLGNNVSTDLTVGVDPILAIVRGKNTIRFNGNSIMVSASPNIVTGAQGTIFTVASNITSGTKVSVSSDNNLGQELLIMDNIAYHNSTANNFVGKGHQCISSIPIDSIVIESATYRPIRFLSDVAHYVNGVAANGSANINNYGSPVDYFNVGRYANIGGRIWFNNPNSGSDLYRGGQLNMYEVLIYDRELNQTEIDLIHEYLKCKYSVNYPICNIPISCELNVSREIVWQSSCSNNTVSFDLSDTALLDSALWNFGDLSSESNTSILVNPSHTYNASDTYVVQVVIWSNGFIDTITDTVDVLSEGIFIPNAFSPNGDGVNDVYRVFGFCFSDFELQIFNRWGSLVFQTTEVDQVWDGSYKGVSLQPDIFVYKITYNESPESVQYKTGSIMLLR